ncbi:uncharacterized protein LOC126744392 isoform X1 [Anthonomus grandis grandis]|uniref:uncharacterized protein LOC126744392 isoform X1 n=1 Tax=Anthonomus grandis grandis TaxID=2921223 RepID=UPI0021662BE9|nr:uncharacterized protein LOC126744392 isoform X1 [Anthonomus grandis grandis]
MESETSTSSSDFEEDLENVAAFLIVDDGIKRKWVHEINKQREELGEYHRLVKELNEHPDRYHMYFRVTKEEFDFLHGLVKEDIKKKNTQFRRAISTEERLAVCLRIILRQDIIRIINIVSRLPHVLERRIVAVSMIIKNHIYSRLSRARRIVENAFGILVSRWRVFRRHFEIQPDFVDKVVLAACCLHNMLSTESVEARPCYFTFSKSSPPKYSRNTEKAR